MTTSSKKVKKTCSRGHAFQRSAVHPVCPRCWPGYYRDKSESKEESRNKPATVAEYIKTFPKDLQSLLRKVRQVIKKAAPKADESISYGMAGYKLAGKPLVYFAGHDNHIGFYATPTGHAAFETELSKYKQGKGSVQFPLTEPIPLSLITKIVKFRAKENLEDGRSKQRKRRMK